MRPLLRCSNHCCISTRQSHPSFPHTLHRVSGDCTCLGTTFGRDLPLRRQLQLRYRPCPARLSLALGCTDGPENGRSARRPTGQPGGRSWASADRATPLTNQVRRVVGTKVLMVQTSSDGSEFSNTCMRVPWHVESRFVGSEDHFLP